MRKRTVEGRSVVRVGAYKRLTGAKGVAPLQTVLCGCLNFNGFLLKFIFITGNGVRINLPGEFE
ncbi:hypothetical protein D3C86_1684860 [compost metagenome]